MKITIEPCSGGVYTAQDNAEHIDKVINMFKGLLVNMGYHPETVDNCLVTEEGNWFDSQEDEDIDEVAHVKLDSLQLIIKQVLDSWSDTQLNMSSDSARVLLSLAIAEQLKQDKHQ
ncbi:hypothetical protein OAU81_00560 [bacterium]|nr:hypothetical protein [bacterium]